mgnify:CR=1 FL=1
MTSTIFKSEREDPAAVVVSTIDPPLVSSVFAVTLVGTPVTVAVIVSPACKPIVDEVAERISQLGEKTIGTMKEFIENSTLKESPKEYASQKHMLEELLENHEQLVTEFRDYIPVFENETNDAGSADFVTGLLQEHEKMAWVLRRYQV